MLDIIVAYAVKNLCYKSARKMTPKGIVVHSTGANNPYLRRYVDAPNEVGVNDYDNHWNRPQPEGRKVCVHSFIGYDKNKQVRIAQILPLDICCWGVGSGPKGSYNFDPAYIQFEICESSLADKTYYRRAFDVAIEYCAELCEKYKIDVSHVVGHCEAYRQGYGCNHSDPEHWMKRHGETMEDFRAAVSEKLKNKTVKEEKNAESVPALTSSDFHKNDLVSLLENATYYNGKPIPSWVKAQQWYIKEEPKGDRVVIDKNETKTSSICSPVHKKYLVLASSANQKVPVKNEASATCPYLVKVTANSLTIRKGAGTNTAKVGFITDNGVYTIVEEKQGIGASLWGKLQSGVGWISLDYVKKR